VRLSFAGADKSRIALALIGLSINAIFCTRDPEIKMARLESSLTIHATDILRKAKPQGWQVAPLRLPVPTSGSHDCAKAGAVAMIVVAKASMAKSLRIIRLQFKIGKSFAYQSGMPRSLARL